MVTGDPTVPPVMLVHYRDIKWFFLKTIEIKTTTGTVITLTGKNPDRQVLGAHDVVEDVEFYPTKEEFKAISQPGALLFRFTGEHDQQTNEMEPAFIEAVKQFVSLMEKNSPTN
jgi:hypothetical protein